MSDWKSVKLGDVAKITMGQSPSSSTYNEFGYGLPFLQGCADFGPKYPIKKVYCSDPLKIAESNSILISVRAPVGALNIADTKYCIGRGLAGILGTSVDQAFLNYLISANIYKLESQSQGSTFAAINSGDLSNLSLKIPETKETQRKIADILGTVDDLIEKTEAAIDKYQAIKAGMMQDLFTRGIDTQTGKLRPTIEEAPELYKESELGWIPKEWEVNSLKEVSAIEYGASPKSITSNDITNIPIFGSSGNLGYATQSLFNAPLIVVARKGTLNKPTLSNTACWVIDTAYAITPASRINCTWLYYQLDAYDLRRLNESTGVPSISRDYLSRIKLKKPEDTIEQDKIANILMDIDNHILSETISRNKYQSIKQGLMADLLTGKVRVNLNHDKVENR
ncbi:MAG: restriction endonuclease subunit S [Candidatus Cloacimonetes bacterium]|nr:restriction endonuclease subunit S [Candidatus Cloacimonadota bacterium]